MKMPERYTNIIQKAAFYLGILLGFLIIVVCLWGAMLRVIPWTIETLKWWVSW